MTSMGHISGLRPVQILLQPCCKTGRSPSWDDNQPKRTLRKSEGSETSPKF